MVISLQPRLKKYRENGYSYRMDKGDPERQMEGDPERGKWREIQRERERARERGRTQTEREFIM